MSVIKIGMEAHPIPYGLSIKIPYGETRIERGWATICLRLGRHIWGYRICNHRNNYFYHFKD